MSECQPHHIDVMERLEKVRRILREGQLQGVVLTSEPNVTWLFRGRYHINVVTETSCAAIYVTASRVEALVNNIEAERLLQEEGLAVDFVHVHPWHDDAARAQKLQSWLNEPGVVLDAEFADVMRALRMTLPCTRLSAARCFGHTLAEALEETCRQTQRGETELSVAARLAKECITCGIEPIVNLVGNERRSKQYRHLLPTEQRIHEYAIVSIGGRRDGMVFSATRMFHFGPVPDELMKRYEAVLRVEAALLQGSRAGQTVGHAFSCGVSQYQREGYEDEWKFHHQGGVAGYQSREIRAVPESDVLLQPNMLMAWNPSIQGVKAEDTALVTNGELEIVTRTSNFPLKTVVVDNTVMELPDILILS